MEEERNVTKHNIWHVTPSIFEGQARESTSSYVLKNLTAQASLSKLDDAARGEKAVPCADFYSPNFVDEP